MKVLVDSCMWGGAADELSVAGHDVVWAGTWEKDPGDEEILRRAHDEGRVVITLDKDFGELAIVRRHAHSGILRLVGLGARQQGAVARQAPHRYAEDLGRGGIVTVEPGRVRLRPADEACP